MFLNGGITNQTISEAIFYTSIYLPLIVR